MVGTEYGFIPRENMILTLENTILTLGRKRPRSIWYFPRSISYFEFPRNKFHIQSLPVNNLYRGYVMGGFGYGIYPERNILYLPEGP